MPYRIQQPFDELQALINALGIYDVPALFDLGDIVHPVSLVNSQITLTAESAPVIPTLRSSAGVLTNPAANTRWANTGQLPAGDYYVQVQATSSTGIHRLILRDAADAADVWVMLTRLTAEHEFQWTGVLTLALNERLVFQNDLAPGAGVVVAATIFTALLV